MGEVVPFGRGHSRAIHLIIIGLLIGAFMQIPAIAVGAANALTMQTAVTRPEAKIGRTDAQRSLTLQVGLKGPDEKTKDALIADLYNPQSPAYHQFLTPAQFTSRFFDTKARAEVVDYFASKGFTVTDPGLGSVISAAGIVAQAEQAFAVTIEDYRDVTGRIFYANDRTPAIPTTVATLIEGIVGLDNAVVPQPDYVTAQPGQTTRKPGETPDVNNACAGAKAVLQNYAYAPNEFGTAYNFDALYAKGFKGQGQTVALYEASDFLDSDVNAYKACFGLSQPVTRVLVNGAVPINGAVGEVLLDIDVVLGMVPNLSSLLVYEGTDTLTQYQKMANDNLAQMISTSYSSCESNTNSAFLDTESTVFMQMVMQGQTLFTSTGDTGSESCLHKGGQSVLSVTNPAGQPYVTPVGGTTAYIAYQTTNQYQSEAVWNVAGSGAGGGGLSQHWARPSWQTGPGVVNPYSNGKRQVPDITAPADPGTGYVVYNGGWSASGGTSGAAPFVAAGYALINQQYTAYGHGPRIGFASPGLYAALSSQPSAFHDVTVGDNCWQGTTCGTPGTPPDKYPTTSGYDLASGVGSFNLGVLAGVVAPAPVGPPSPSPAPPGRPGPTVGGTPISVPSGRPGPSVGGSPVSIPKPRS
ncbi:MAG: S53 family peptidase [Chloroflexota bacterium]|nr:S53 family peptidase [Chloroflexota bacterium]